MRLAAVLIASALAAAAPSCGQDRSLSRSATAGSATAGSATAGLIRHTGRMHAERAAHTATLLKDGRVLIAGGLSGAALRTAEVYDPKAQRFINVGAMRSARAGHTATLLASGNVLITGGYNGEYLRSCELFDPVTGQFSSGGQMEVPRSGHRAVLLQTGKVLLVGGVGTGWSFLRSVEIYEPSTQTSRATGSLSESRESHTATLLSDGRVLVAGGHNGRRPNVRIFSSAEVYDPRIGTFTSTGTMIVSRHKHDAVLLGDGRVLVTGGSDERDGAGMYATAEIYDPRSGTFTRKLECRVPRFKHEGTSLLLPNKKVALLGGAAEAQVYDPTSDTIARVDGSFGEARFFATATLLANGEALVTGGYTADQQVTAMSWVYRP